MSFVWKILFRFDRGWLESRALTKWPISFDIFFFYASVGVSKKKEKYWCNHIRVVRPPERIVLYISQFHTTRHKLAKNKKKITPERIFIICIYAFSAQLTILEMGFKCTITTHAIHIYIRKKCDLIETTKWKKTTIRHGMYNTLFFVGFIFEKKTILNHPAHRI